VNSWKVIFATVLIFGAGVITGGLLVNYVQRCGGKTVHSVTETKPAAPVEVRPTTTNPPVNVMDNPKVKPPEILSKQFLQRLNDELHLKTEQHEAIQKIIGEGQNQIRKTIQDARLEIRDVLTPEQQKQFDELVKRPFKRPIFNTNAPAATATNVLSTRTNTP
jgi:hypothetical protein